MLTEIGTIAVNILLKSVPVNEVVSSPVLSAATDDEVAEAARIMLENKVGSLPAGPRRGREALVLSGLAHVRLPVRIISWGERAPVFVRLPQSRAVAGT